MGQRRELRPQLDEVVVSQVRGQPGEATAFVLAFPPAAEAGFCFKTIKNMIFGPPQAKNLGGTTIYIYFGDFKNY